MRCRSVFVGVGIASVAFLAACGSDSSSSSAAGGGQSGAAAGGNGSGSSGGGGSATGGGGGAAVSDPCSILTQSAAASVIGSGATKQTTGAGNCTYITTSGGVVTASLAAVPGGGAQLALQAALTANGQQFQSVSGIGDAAGETDVAGAVTIAAVKGGTLLILAVSNPTGGSDVKGKAEDLARQLIGKV